MTRILVIDDELLILESVELSFPDDQVTLCATAQAGIDEFLKSTPDVVLCDIRLNDYENAHVRYASIAGDECCL